MAFKRFLWHFIVLVKASTYTPRPRRWAPRPDLPKSFNSGTYLNSGIYPHPGIYLSSGISFNSGIYLKSELRMGSYTIVYGKFLGVKKHFGRSRLGLSLGLYDCTVYSGLQEVPMVLYSKACIYATRVVMHEPLGCWDFGYWGFM